MKTILRYRFGVTQSSCFEIVRHDIMESDVSHYELLEIKDPPLGKKQFILYSEDDFEIGFHEFETLEAGVVAFLMVKNEIENPGNPLTTEELKIRDIPCLRYVSMRSNSDSFMRIPWFFASRVEDVQEDFSLN